MRVDAAGRNHHGGFRREPDRSEFGHAGLPLPGAGKDDEERMDGIGASRERAGVHVAMTAAVDQAHETWLGPCRQLVK